MLIEIYLLFCYYYLVLNICLLFYYSAPLIILGLNLKVYLAAILLIIMFLINYFSIKTNQQNRSIIDLLSKTKLLQLDKNPYTKKTKL